MDCGTRCGGWEEVNIYILYTYVHMYLSIEDNIFLVFMADECIAILLVSLLSNRNEVEYGRGQ